MVLVLAVLLAQLPSPEAAPVLGAERADTLEAAAPRAALPPVEARAVPAEALRELRADPSFQYDRPEAEAPSLWDRFWAWLWRSLLAPAGRGIVSKPTQWAVMALAGGVLLWVLLRVLRGEGSGLFGRRDVGAGEAGDPLLDVEDIEAVDLGARLDAALGEGDHRAAVRLRYLLALQRLARAGHIEWARDKTNRTYVVEARASRPDLGRAVADVTRVFDHVWYGGLGVDAARYARFATRFDRLDALLDGAPALQTT